MSGAYDAFDTDDNLQFSRPDKEIWEYDIFDKSQWGDVSKWLLGEKNLLIEENRSRFRVIQNNLALYKGIQYQSQQLREDTRDQGIDRAQSVTKIVANHIYDLVQNKTSRLIKFKPGIAVLPTSNELEDKVGAKMSKTLLDHIWYMQSFEGEIQNEFIKYTHVMGECYLGVIWDKNSGQIVDEVTPYLKNLEDGKPVILKDDSGNPELDDDGKPIKLDRIVKYGDTVYEIWNTLDVLVHRKDSFKKANYLFHKRPMSIPEARKKYGRFAQKEITGESDGLVYDYEKMQTRKLRNEVILWKFYHKKTEMMPKGAEITFIGDQIVDVKPLQSTGGGLPVVRLTDVDLPGELHGVSFIQLIKGLTGTYNNVVNMIVRNQVLTSHPKWMFPVGSVKKESLGNDITMVEYKGGVAPQLVQQNPTSPELFTWLPTLKQEFQQIAGIFGVSRGEPPPGIKAGVALQFLAEQENERFNELVLKYNEWIRQTALMTLERCGDNYDPSDKRMIMVLGRNNKWMTTFFDVKYLSRKYDVRVQNSSALPQSKAARTQYLLDLNAQFPNQVSPDQVLDMLDLSQPEKFLDNVTISVKAAEAENEAMLEGIAEINDPEVYEDHISHWRIHTKQIREWSFKNQTKIEIQDQFKDHLLATEMLMFQKGQENPEYAKLLMTLEGFPILFKPPTLPQPPPAPMDWQGPLPEQIPPELEAAYGESPETINQMSASIIDQMTKDGQLPEATQNIQPTTTI